MKLTVFLLTYNHAKWIRTCFDSLLAEKTDFPFKIVVLDDASTDGTSDIVRDYAAKHPDKIVPVIREKNLGIVENVWQGLCSVDTPYFTVIEGDDFRLGETGLQRMVALLDAHPEYDICGHDTILRNFITGKENRFYRYKGDMLFLEGLDLPKLHPSARVFRTKYDFSKAEPKTGVVFDSSLFWYYALHNPRLIFINETLSVYNYTGEGLYSGATQLKQKLHGMHSQAALNVVTRYEFDGFIRRIFRRILFKRHRLWFDLLSLVKGPAAQDWFIKKYERDLQTAARA